MLVTSPSRLPEALLEPTHILPPSQEPKVVMDICGAGGRMVQGGRTWECVSAQNSCMGLAWYEVNPLVKEMQ